MTSEMLRTHWMPWMGACWMAGNFVCRWQGMDVPHPPTEGAVGAAGGIKTRNFKYEPGYHIKSKGFINLCSVRKSFD